MEKNLNFAELNNDEKEKYIEFIISNNIQFEEDSHSNSFIANIKVKSTRPRTSQSSYEARPTALRTQKHIDNGKSNDNKNAFKLAGDILINNCVNPIFPRVKEKRCKFGFSSKDEKTFRII